MPVPRSAAHTAARAGLLAALALSAFSAPARAFELFDGRIQLHGYVETQMRGIVDDYNLDAGFDLSQWYNVVNLELEVDVAPDGWGPFDEIGAYVRVEARYDCVWNRACWLARSADAYGDRARRLPKRSSDARKNGLIGTIRPAGFADERPRIDIPYTERGDEWAVPMSMGGLGTDPLTPVPGQRHLGRIWNLPGIGQLLFSGRGYDFAFDPDPGRVSPTDPGIDPGLYVTQNFLGYRFGMKRVDGTANGNGTAVLGPYRPKDDILPFGVLRDRANPFRAGDVHPVLRDPDTGLPITGFGALPFRPAPFFAFDDDAAPPDAARGLFYPNAGLRPLLERDRFGAKDQNFTESELAWNHGAAQQDERELKEAYLDLSLLDYRLWMRIGKQTIVWGKTEIFRAQDQFNPQDLGLASLPSLEESRIPLWALRVIYSLYDVGPLEDVRIEGAVNFDQFEPADLGRCGEPYAPPVACLKAFGYFAHGIAGTGLAGEFRPADPWDHTSGLEGGVRVEFRVDRVSFALSDWYGYSDTPYVDQIFVFERNVDPLTGRPRRAGSREPCDPDGVYTAGDRSGCLGVVAADGSVVDGDAHRADVLENHHANQQLFATICATTVGFSALLRNGCALDTWNSRALAQPDMPAISPRISTAFSAMLAGQGFRSRFLEGAIVDAFFNGKAALLVLGGFDTLVGAIPSSEAFPPFPPSARDEDDLPLVPLVRDPGDAANQLDPITLAMAEPDLMAPEFNAWLNWARSGLAPYLTDAQEALLGCGEFWGTHCDIDGFDILNAEASVLFQSWPGVEGTAGAGWDTFDASIPQPGTIGFYGGTPAQPYGPDPYVCTRYVGGETVLLAGCLDGTAPFAAQVNPQTMPRVPPPGFPSDPYPALLGGHPFTGQPWASEMAALSWNALVTFVTLSTPDDVDDDGVFDAPPRFDEFDPRDPFNPDKCSYRNPVVCKSVSSLLLVSGAQRNAVRAGGNERFGRRDFVWHGGAVAGLRYRKRNVLGFSMDFAEDRTKTNVNMEFTWFNGLRFTDFDEFDGLSSADTYNLVLSVDRPTFIRFLNPSRTFFFNAQMFVQYIDGYRRSFSANGPWNFLWTFAVFTGYFQDRLSPSLIFVYDRRSNSGAVLPSITYRFTQSFSVQLGMGIFYGRTQRKTAPLVPLGIPANGALDGAYHSYVDNGLSSVRDRDEVFLRIRYTF